MKKIIYYIRHPQLILLRVLAKFGFEKRHRAGFFGLLCKFDLPHSTCVFQVGASYGQELDYFNYSGVETCICFEPIPSVFEELSKKTKLYGWTAFNKALGSKKRLDKFYLASNQGISASLLKPGTVTVTYPHITFNDFIDVEVDVGSEYVRRFASAMIVGTNPVLYLDTQGYELEVLKGFADELDSFSYVYTEVGYGIGYEGAVSINKLCTFLFNRGFELLDLTLWGRSGEGDALFAKNTLIAGR
jgi:FkbM family methyltransferase